MCELDPTDPDVTDALASHADDYEVRRELHRMPPHVTYEVVVDGQRAVCKLVTHPEADPTTEARILQYVERETAVPVPRVIAIGEDYFIAEWHDEAPQKAPPVDMELAELLGSGLATLHEEARFDSYGFLRAGEGGLELDACETWQATVVDFLTDFREWLEPHGYAAVATAALDFVREHPEVLADAGDPVLCHGNYVPDHVGTADGEVACLIDFEHALVGPGEYDYWRAVLPTFYSIDGGVDEAGAEAFRAGYESVRSLPEGFDDRRAVYWMINTVSYLQSLFVQDRHSEEETQQHAEWMAEYVFETLDSLAKRVD